MKNIPFLHGKALHQPLWEGRGERTPLPTILQDFLGHNFHGLCSLRTVLGLGGGCGPVSGQCLLVPSLPKYNAPYILSQNIGLLYQFSCSEVWICLVYMSARKLI